MPRKFGEYLDILQSTTAKMFLLIGKNEPTNRFTNITCIRKHLKTTPSTAYKISNILHKNGFITKLRKDGRTNKIFLTKKGETIKWHMLQIKKLIN